MMLWCEIHAAGGIKGVTNFDLTEYERDVGWLTSITQVSKSFRVWLV
jgi:hypothetical protein